ncbi:ferritin-like domain-containing protein [Deinococcus deserti]|uniref:Putative Desiccation-associated protein n=1 Tax=Deinococcus deserti (strain DSM 17065 / CIP 109153 / LMG 22923 / VCD115) TaxID=546414 RepID=C1D191_DEIDV|nr:ferritin-like domain-containing protein [Deinococcus deserti]ACO45615.1 putative Desiccation-associated protein, precursor [Deinococcus deserti VCD115]
MSNDNSTTPGQSTRRKFLGMAGLMGAGAVLSGCTSVMATPKEKTNLDATIFNFALNLEYLEAAFYLAAVGRLGELDAAGGSSARVSLPAGFNGMNGTGISTLSPEIRAIANEIATDELAHVKVIRAVLGNAAVAQPQINLSTAFQAAGSAASGGAITGFDPFANELFFLHGAFIFEDVGVTAYKGAARLLVDDKPAGNLENAAGILAVEAYHAGAIRALLNQRRGTAVTASLNVEAVVGAISNLRDAVDGADDRDQGISHIGAGANISSNIVPTDANGIAYSRTPRQVANIVFLDTSGKAGSGGFFPNGLNGNFGAILAL